jgi:nucleoside-diphosphate-sugar epimerase
MTNFPQVDVLIFGCGYVGLQVARQFVSAGLSCAAVTRSQEKAAILKSQSIEPVLAEITEAQSLAVLPAAKRILWAVGYDRNSTASKREVYVDGLRNALIATAPAAESVVSISSTSVWGFDDGRWVDELTPVAPSTEGGEICATAEEVVRTLCPAGKFTILRLAGIYGPGRLLAKVEALKHQQPIAGSGEAWLNLIHQADAAALAYRLLCEGGPEVVVGVDREPVQRIDYYSELARRIGSAPPVFDEASLPKRGSGGLNKRVRSQFSDQFEFRYESYRSGLAQAVESPPAV